MPNPTTHILIAIILVELFREYFVKDNKKFPRYYILIAAVAGIIPDLDLLAYYGLYFFGFSFQQVHRTFLHSLLIPLVLFLLGLVFYKLNIKNKVIGKRHMKISIILFIFAAGSVIHILLDILFGGIIMPFYPFSDISIGFNLFAIFPDKLEWMMPHTLDAALLFFWLIWMEFKLKVREYF